MEKEPARIQSLIEKYLCNECSENERDELLQDLGTPQGMRVLEETMDEEVVALFRSHMAITPEVSARIFNRLQDRILTEQQASDAPTIPFYRKHFWRVAASVAAVILMVVAGLLWSPGNDLGTYTTEAGQKRTVILEDGSRVTLNGNSSFSFRSTGQRREVSLNGEAYFDVAHETGRPFFVKTSEIEIKVLGTAFNVKSYQQDDAVETTLVRGKVQVKNLDPLVVGREEIALLPNERAVFRKTAASLTKTVLIDENETNWRKGNLTFEDVPMRRLLPELEKWYRVKISTDEHSLDCRFSMNIGDESLEDVLRFLEATTGVKTEKHGKEVRILGALCD